MFQESIRSTQWEIQHQKQHVKQHVKHWFFATVVAGAGKGNFQLPDTAAVSPFLIFEILFCFSAFLAFFTVFCICACAEYGKIQNVWNIPDYLVSIYGG